MIKLLCVFALNLLISAPTYALVVEQKNINFVANTEALIKGEVHYALDVVSKQKFHKKYADLYDLDSLAFMNEPDVRMVISKSAFIVEKPVGFFDHLNTVDEKFIDHVLGEQKVKKLGENEFRVNVPGNSGYAYKMKTFFDSDDISTLPNSKAIRAVTQAKKLDVIAQSASSITYKELTTFSKYFVGGVQVSTYIPLKENKTLVLNYSLLAVKKYYALKKVLKHSLM
ncbi:MAG: hypothetical protein H0V66_15315, partial [Bdellovibrionales bacterium]|nr:hypothetical protein [Bdellovibrionales bacterium]